MSDMTNIHKEIAIPNRIFLKGLDISIKEDDIRNIFIKYGSIIEVKIIRDPVSGESKGYGFVTFDSQLVAENVLSKCKLVEILDREVMVGPAKIRRKPPPTKIPRDLPPLTHNRNCPSVPYTVSPDGLFMFYQNPYLVQAPVFTNHLPPSSYMPTSAVPPPRYPTTTATTPHHLHSHQKPLEQAWPHYMMNEYGQSQMQHHPDGHFIDGRAQTTSSENSSSNVKNEYRPKLDYNREMYHQTHAHRIPSHEIETEFAGLHVNNHLKKSSVSPNHHVLSHQHPVNHYLPSTTNNHNFPIQPTEGNYNVQMANQQENHNNIAITLFNGGMPPNSVMCRSLCCLPITTISQHTHHQKPTDSDQSKNEIKRAPNETDKIIPNSISTNPKLKPGRNNQQQHFFGGDPTGKTVNLKDQKYEFMSTGLGRVKRVVVVQP